MKSNKAREFHESQRAQLEDRLASRERTLEQLESELRARHDYEEVKRELSILKTIEFSLPMSSGETGSNGGGSEGSNGSGNMVTNAVGAPAGTSNEPSSLGGAAQQKPLEILLLEKNRYLQTENTQVKNRLSDLVAKHELVSKEHATMARINLEQKALIIELEKDLLKVARGQQSLSSGELGFLFILVDH